MSKDKILIVEDEKGISSFISAILAASGYRTIQAYNGKNAIGMVASHSPDLILLDLGLPDVDGMDVLKKIREWSEIPVIVISARQNESEKVAALDCGANDYVTKPFGNDELLARIRTALRIQNNIASSRKERVFKNGDLQIDYEKRYVLVGGRRIHLTPIEYRIIVLLSQNAGKVLTHDYLLRQLWGPYFCDNQILRVNVANIRRKIEENPADPGYILTEIGVGYRMNDLQEDFPP
jgi:two-component system KDP operon response regulator KdpE